jgi:hypothetical protein
MNRTLSGPRMAALGIRHLRVNGGRSLKPPARDPDSGPGPGLATSLDAGEGKGSVPRRRPSSRNYVRESSGPSHTHRTPPQSTTASDSLTVD